MNTSTALIIDPNPLTGLSTRVALKRHAMTGQIAQSATQALALLDDGLVPDVVLCDYSLPGDGLDCLRQIRARLPYVALVVTCAPAVRVDARSLASIGAFGPLVQPFNFSTLINAVSRFNRTETLLHAEIEDLRIADVLQMLHLNRRTLRVEVDRQGFISMEDGDIVHAELEEAGQHLIGEIALQRIINRINLNIRTTEESAPERSISGRFEHLLLDALAQGQNTAPFPAVEEEVLEAEEEAPPQPPRRPSGLRRLLGLRFR
jgi:CheY-like chemotaxis protein